ncbi:nicotinate (nicotinamide) nucleotide adenylyltransferase [Leptospira brenneri]|uniref:Probable nicotinate-nucleotide adenylyltransferase n=1 Tax=Leptospira brenneri TaxID=2023182 RepID=A0A2M9Y154_9LEPT|nr:nicotinate (nicotinamide) nucleotide adenylyltransferase [Leptospira brenneri]PJZ45282.1 nicotinate (nicotinamide) nucleotide adenylyltransferase [Leptospira brenneri]TGK91770.1 nicotinate (nicotinamide) nucleotide adenylyltransferase [Leptospira brenneri]
MEVLFFGGSFNPPHRGHRHVIESITKSFPHAKLYICPNFVSPLKDAGKDFQANEIWELCLAEFEDFLSENVILWDEEIKQPNVSYTISTLAVLKNLHPNSEISLVIGEDNLETFDQWKSYSEILKLIFSLIVVRRETPYPKEIPLPKFIPKEKLKVLENPILALSSTEIRQISEVDWNHHLVLPKTKELALEFQKGKEDSSSR